MNWNNNNNFVRVSVILNTGVLQSQTYWHTDRDIYWFIMWSNEIKKTKCWERRNPWIDLPFSFFSFDNDNDNNDDLDWSNNQIINKKNGEPKKDLVSFHFIPFNSKFNDSIFIFSTFLIEKQKLLIYLNWLIMWNWLKSFNITFVVVPYCQSFFFSHPQSKQIIYVLLSFVSYLYTEPKSEWRKLPPP